MGFLRLVTRSISVSGRTVIDNATKDGELRVFIVSGEVSGDSIGSRLMASLKKLCPVPVRFLGVGGSMMSRQELNSLFPMEDISVMGIWELLPHLNKIRVRSPEHSINILHECGFYFDVSNGGGKAFVCQSILSSLDIDTETWKCQLKLKETVEAAFLFQPHVVVTVDSKGFSFRLLKQLRANYGQQGVDGPVHFHYVAPSFWAWKGGEARLKGLAEFVDQVFCILPNEEEVCKSNGLAATFVGHPILEDIFELNSGKDAFTCEWKVEGACEDIQSKNAIPAGATVISLLPGSRLQEVKRMLSIYANAMGLLKDTFPQLMAVIHVAPNQHASKVALCTSGTVALELQLARLPCVVAYRAHFLTEWFIRYKAKISYSSLPNILLGSAIIPEALFEACTPKKLATLLMELIHNEGPREEQIIAAEKVISLLYPSEGTINNLSRQDSRLRFPDCTPSMIAAATILYHMKP